MHALHAVFQATQLELPFFVLILLPAAHHPSVVLSSPLLEILAQAMQT